MEDPALNRRIEETRELYTRWGQFHDFFTMAMKGEKITPEAEMKFLELKTRIAMLHDGFMQSLKHDQKVGQQVLGILGACILLRRIPLMNNAEVQKLELDWNEAYMLMNETIAGLEEDRQKLANINEQAYRLNKMKEMTIQKIHNFFVSSAFIFCFFFIIIPAFLIWGVPGLGIYDYTHLPTDLPWTKKPYNWVVDHIIRHIMDMPYAHFDEIKPNVQEWKDHHEDTKIAAPITVDFLGQQLSNLGFAPETLDEAHRLIAGRADYGKEARVLNTKRDGKMYAMYIVFKEIHDADRFVELRQKSVGGFKKEVQEKLRGTVNICKKQNFVAIFVSEEKVLREDYPKEKWGFSDTQMKLGQ